METSPYQIGDTVRFQTVEEDWKDQDLRVNRVNDSFHDIEVENSEGRLRWINWDLVQPVSRVRGQVDDLLNQ